MVFCTDIHNYKTKNSGLSPGFVSNRTVAFDDILGRAYLRTTILNRRTTPRDFHTCHSQEQVPVKGKRHAHEVVRQAE